jgi:hypothetical protein
MAEMSTRGLHGARRLEKESRGRGGYRSPDVTGAPCTLSAVEYYSAGMLKAGASH